MLAYVRGQRFSAHLKKKKRRKMTAWKDKEKDYLFHTFNPYVSSWYP